MELRMMLPRWLGGGPKVYKAKGKKLGHNWKRVHSLEQINMHSHVRLIKKPAIEGEVRHIDHLKKRIEFNHLGRPVFAKIHEIKVLVRKEI